MATAAHVIVHDRTQNGSHLRRIFESRHTIYFLIALGILVRVIPLALVGGRFLAHENPSYDIMAGQLLRNERFSGYWPPGLPYYLAFFHALFGYGMLVARASILLVYVGFSFALYALVKAVGSRRAANLAVLTFAFYPSYIRYAFDPSTEYLTACCLLLIVYCTILTLRNPSLALALALGVCLGAVALVRANSLALAVVIPAYIAFRTRTWRMAIVPMMISSVLISAWLWKASHVNGRFIFINDSNEENLVFSNHPDTPLYLTCRDCPIYGMPSASFLELEHDIDYKPPLEKQRQLRETTIRFVLTRPDLFAVRTINRFRAYFRFPIHYADPLVRHSSTGKSLRQWLGTAITVLEAAFFWPLITLAIVAWFSLPTLGIESDVLYVVLGVASVYALPCWLTWSEPRYAFPVIPLFAVFSFVLLDALLTRPWRQVLAPVLNSMPRKRAVLIAVSIFCCIQIEWIVLIVCANALHDKWARLTSF